jgi:large subunit ribosomal protein L23Ae
MPVVESTLYLTFFFCLPFSAKSDAPKAPAAKAATAKAPAAAKPKVPKAKKPVPKKTTEKKAEGAAVEKTVKSRVPHRKVHKAQRIQKKVVKGTHGTRVKKVRTSVHFHRPRTFRPARNPKYPRKSTPKRNR